MSYVDTKKNARIAQVLVIGAGGTDVIPRSLQEQLVAIADEFKRGLDIVNVAMAKNRQMAQIVESADKAARIEANNETIRRMKAKGSKTNIGKHSIRAGKSRQKRQTYSR